MPLNSQLEAVYYIRGWLHIYIARELNNGTPPNKIQNGKTIASYVGTLRYNTICLNVGREVRKQRPTFSYPNGFIDDHKDATVGDFAYDAANIIFPPQI